MSDELECSHELDELARQIRVIGKRAYADIIEIGRLLTAAKALAGHGNWLSWLDQNFGWSGTPRHAGCGCTNFRSKIRNLRNLTLSDLYLLAAKNTPPPVLAEIATRVPRRAAIVRRR
jgi:hypothetical protein